MGRTVKINWSETRRHSDVFRKDAEELMSLLEEMDETFDSVRDGWHGKDAENYILNSKELIEEMKKEPIFLMNWHNYINKTTYRYNDNVEQGLSRVRSVNSMFADDYEEIKHKMGA